LKLSFRDGVLAPTRHSHRSVRVGVAGGCFVLLVSCSGLVPSASRGKVLYQTNGCASCHGASGLGNGPLAANLPASPTNLRDPGQFTKGTSEGEIAKTLAEGIVNAQISSPHLHHTHHDLAMPKFDHLSETERRSIALYVISMQKNAN
jgi:mono/diheme cytochrome c family protein